MLELQQDMGYNLTREKQVLGLLPPLTNNFIYRRYDVMAKPTLAKKNTKRKTSQIIDLTGQRFGKLKL